MKWFYLNDNFVKGPYSTDDLKILIEQSKNPREAYVWTRGQMEWITSDLWNPHMQQQAQQEAQQQGQYHAPQQEQPQSTQGLTAPSAFVDHTSEMTSGGFTNTQTLLESRKNATLIQGVSEDTASIPVVTLTDIPAPSLEKAYAPDYYRVQLNFIEQEQMTMDKIIQFTAQQEDVSKIAIYDKATHLWKEVYAFPEIVERLGLTRRKHPRVPILAQFNGSTSRHEKFHARVITVSEGGLGFTDVFDLQIGDSVQGQMTSPHFYSPVKIEAEVTYSGQDGYVGLRFTQMNDDAKSLILDYVNRFANNT